MPRKKKKPRETAKKTRKKTTKSTKTKTNKFSPKTTAETVAPTAKTTPEQRAIVDPQARIQNTSEDKFSDMHDVPSKSSHKMGFSSHSESSFLEDSIYDEVTIYSEERFDPHASTYSFDEITIADERYQSLVCRRSKPVPVQYISRYKCPQSSYKCGAE
jgi:hypothetical protein